jgi:hypothetical protein
VPSQALRLHEPPAAVVNLLAWTVGQVLGVVQLVALVVVLRVLIDALTLFHHAGMARIHRSTR